LDQDLETMEILERVLIDMEVQIREIQEALQIEMGIMETLETLVAMEVLEAELEVMDIEVEEVAMVETLEALEKDQMGVEDQEEKVVVGEGLGITL